MSLKYKIFPQQKLFVDILAGVITTSKLHEFHKSYRENPTILCVEKVLTHVIATDFRMSIDEIMEYIDLLKKEAFPPNFKWAILTASPNSTMFSMLIKEEPHFKNNVEVFCTITGAANYLNIKFDESLFNESGYYEIE